MTDTGWIKLHRSLRRHWVWEDPLMLKLWICILFSANHDEATIVINDTPMTIDRGQFWTSKQKLATEIKVDRKTLDRKLKCLMQDGMIFVDSRAGYGTLITVNNYSRFQGEIDKDGTYFSPGFSPRDSTKSGQDSPHKQEVKKDKESKNNIKAAPVTDAWGAELQ